MNTVHGKQGQGLGKGHIQHGGHGGHQALNLAHWLSMDRDGVKPKAIYLLGYDMGATGITHWFGLHPKDKLPTGHYPNFVPQYKRISEDLQREGVPVINLTRETALTQFERSTVDAIGFDTAA